MDIFDVPKKVNRHILKALSFLSGGDCGKCFPAAIIMKQVVFQMRRLVRVPDVSNVIGHSLRNLSDLGFIEEHEGNRYSLASCDKWRKPPAQPPQQRITDFSESTINQCPKEDRNGLKELYPKLKRPSIPEPLSKYKQLMECKECFVNLPKVRKIDPHAGRNFDVSGGSSEKTLNSTPSDMSDEILESLTHHYPRADRRGRLGVKSRVKQRNIPARLPKYKTLMKRKGRYVNLPKVRKVDSSENVAEMDMNVDADAESVNISRGFIRSKLNSISLMEISNSDDMLTTSDTNESVESATALHAEELNNGEGCSDEDSE